MKLVRLVAWTAAAVLLGFASLQGGARQHRLGLVALAAESAEIDSARYLADVKFLASEALEGRGNGTPGLEKAADYIAEQFRAAGLTPAGESGTYFQRFRIITGLQIGNTNFLSFSRGAERTRLELGKGYFPLSVDVTDENAPAPEMAVHGTERWPLVFAGYGITAPGLQYDDYAGIDVRDKAALVFTHEPQEERADSRFEGTRQTRYADVMAKVMEARAHGARLLLLVEDFAHAAETDRYGAFLRDPQAAEYGIPVIRVRRDNLRSALGGALDLEETHRQIDADLQPRSRPLADVSVSLAEQFVKTRRDVRNVVAMLQGRDPLHGSEAVVVGAHYDHLGLGGRHSLAPQLTGEIHNGADDNASGTAAMLEIARAAAANPSGFPRSVVFVAFAAEEIGLLGSAYYADQPAVPLDRTVAMINLDMIGRPAGRILLSGLDSAPDLEADVKAARAGSSLDVKTFGQGAAVGSSDDTSFLIRHIPSIAFFSGFHADYHRPTDDWEKIDVAGATDVARFALALTRQLAARADRPRFVETTATAHGSRGPDASGGGYGPYFGSVPDFSEQASGVRFAEIREDSPAGKAGLRRGDVLVSFGGAPIKNLYDFTFALRSKHPGDRVEVIVLRAGAEVRTVVELGTRP